MNAGSFPNEDVTVNLWVVRVGSIYTCSSYWVVAVETFFKMYLPSDTYATLFGVVVARERKIVPRTG